MSIEFQCKNCGARMKVDASKAGKTGKCPKCGHIIRVPEIPAEVKGSLEVGSPPHEPAPARDQPTPVGTEPAPQPVASQPSPPAAGMSGSISQPQAVSSVPPPQRPYVPTVNVVTPRRSSSFGIASIILGILALLICWVPLIGILGLPLSALGLLLGVIGLIIALTRKGSGMGYCIAGTAIAGIAFLIGMLQILFVSAAGATAAAGAADLADALAEDQKKATRTNQETVSPPAARPRLADETDAGARTGESDQTPESGIRRPDTPAKTEWALASTPVKQGDIQVQVLATTVGKVQLVDSIDGSRGTSQDAVLSIKLEIRNVGRNRKVEYKSWMGADFTLTRDYASLTDNFNNKYKRINFGFTAKPVGHSASDSIYPSKSINDVLVFEEPIETIEHLNLELPAKNFGGEGMLRIRIPADMVRWKQ